MLNNLNNLSPDNNPDNYFLVPSYCGEYLVKHDHMIWSDDCDHSFASSDKPNGENGDWFEGLLFINPNHSSSYLIVLQSLGRLWNDILPNHGADDDVYDYIPDYIRQILFLASQISGQVFEVTTQILENMIKSEDPRHPGKSYREVFNSEDSFKPLPDDFTTLKCQDYLDQVHYLKDNLKPEDINRIFNK